LSLAETLCADLLAPFAALLAEFAAGCGPIAFAPVDPAGFADAFLTRVLAFTLRWTAAFFEIGLVVVLATASSTGRPFAEFKAVAPELGTT